MFFFQNLIFMQHEFFTLEYTFICLSSNGFFFWWNTFCTMNNGITKCKEDLNTESAKWGFLHFTCGLLPWLQQYSASQRHTCARLRLRVLFSVLENWSKFARCSIIINCYSDNHYSDASPSTHILVYWTLDGEKIKQQKGVLSRTVIPKYATTHKQTSN